MFFILFVTMLTACTGNPEIENASLMVTIHDQQQVQQVKVNSGSNVQSALDTAGIKLSELDRSEPPTYTIIQEPLTIQIIRVIEEFDVEEEAIPFERQVIKNDSLTEGEQRLVQPGANGLRTLTYRRILENGIEVSRTLFATDISLPAQPEIIMIGVRSPFTSVPFPGRLAYLSGGNAWLMERNSGNRVPLITSGDLDGRIFNLSPDGNWLLFSRKTPSGSDDINNLWLFNLEAEETEPVALNISNVIHFADWAPTSPQLIYYSTVEPRSTAPGWQANNDLRAATIGADGRVLSDEEVIGVNSGGIYGWWGTHFLWSQDGSQLAFARPDSVGLVDFSEGQFSSLMEILPLQTRSEWAWVPGIAWSADSRLLFVVTHEKSAGLADSEISPVFNLSSVSIDSANIIPLVRQVGMFAAPQFAPVFSSDPPRLAFLEAIFPDQSESSRYRLVVMDQDGSNRQVLFPPEGSLGLDPQSIVWSPERQDGQPRYIGFLYQGDLWLLDSETARSQQLTGDGLINRIAWK